jgi:hypothetical protein
MKLPAWSMIAAMSFGFGVATGARAQNGFACPRAGTVVQFSNGKQIYDGSEPDDPVLCRVTLQSGRHVRRLYNWFIIDDWIPGHDKPVRRAMQALFSGQENEVTFDVFPSNLDHRIPQTWRHLSQETLAIGGHLIATTIYRHEISAFFPWGNRWTRSMDRAWNLWFNSSTGIFVKQKLIWHAGIGTPPVDWVALSVTIP